MKLNNTVVTLALLGVLALAALAGGLLPMGNVVHGGRSCVRRLQTHGSVPENTPPGVNIGDPVSATDADETGETQATTTLEFGHTLTYKLGGTTRRRSTSTLRPASSSPRPRWTRRR